MHLITLLGAQNDERGNLSDMAVLRAEGALEAYRSTPGSRFLIHGGYGHFNRAERPHGYYLRQFLLGRGLDPSHVLGVLESAHTVDEGLRTYRFLDGRDAIGLTIVTSNHHMARARLIFEHFFSPALLEYVSTGDGVDEDELRTRRAHEAMRVEEILDQGGVLVDGTLWARKT